MLQTFTNTNPRQSPKRSEYSLTAAPKLYHAQPARVKEFYKLLHLMGVSTNLHPPRRVRPVLKLHKFARARRPPSAKPPKFR